MSALEDTRVPDLFFAGALIYRRDENGDLVPTWFYRAEPFREAFFRSGLTVSEVDRRAGWKDGYFARAIGLRPSTTMTKGRTYTNTIQRLGYAQAVRVARALDLDFVEWEL